MSGDSRVNHIVKKLKDKSTTGTGSSKGSRPDVIEIDGHMYDLCLTHIDELKDNPFQYRKTYDQEGLESLAQSIREKGLIHPVVFGMYEGEKVLLVGHRRKRAANLAEALKILSINIGEVTAKDLASFVYVENDEREKVHPVEQAFGYRRILDQEIFENQDEFAASIQKSPSYVTMRLGYLKLAPEIIEDLQANKSTWDSYALDVIRKIPDPKRQVDVYFDFVKNKRNREWLKEEAAKTTKQKKPRFKSNTTIGVIMDGKKTSLDFDTKGLSKTELKDFSDKLMVLLKEFELLK